jgi:3-hydroxy-9,10-secoandrosta-1,3,5(10)-triene-9,17-dione monooxygenase reductase component
LCDDRSVSTTIDPRELRRLMSHWATGVAVITSRGDTGPRGATTNALTSLSLDPLLVLVALDRGSNTLEAVRHSGRFCVNVLAAGQEELAHRFATKASGEEKLAGIEHELIDGVPVLGGTLAWLACELDHELEGGDHAILIGRPLEAGADPAARPLVFFGGRYHAGTLDGP